MRLHWPQKRSSHGRDQPNAAPPPGDPVLLRDAVLTCRDNCGAACRTVLAGTKRLSGQAAHGPMGISSINRTHRVILLGQGDKSRISSVLKPPMRTTFSLVPVKPAAWAACSRR